MHAYNQAADHSQPSVPTPYQEGLGCPEHGVEYCGFESITQMRNWFPKSSQDSRMSQVGIEVSVYEIEPHFVRKGSRQVLFHLHKARRVDRQPLESF
jgi:hypothetical protein